MTQIIHIVLQDGLQLPTSFLAQAEYTCHLYLQVPDELLSGDLLSQPTVEAMLEQLYGKRWRQSNSDGSSYVVLSMTATLMSAQDVADRLWLIEKAQNSRDQFWFYHVNNTGQFESKEATEFNQQPLQ